MSEKVGLSELVVAIPTYHRPDALAAVLDKVLPQVAEMNTGTQFHASVLVVDNDKDGSGRAVAERLGVRYVIEPRPGIATTRNRALVESLDAHVLVFIDDDETPGRGWLAALVAKYLKTGATAIAGRVITTFPQDVDPWIKASGAFIRPIRWDESELGEAATNNLLLDLVEVRALGLCFDTRFGLTGGSDSLFTRTIVMRGGTIRWAQQAVVFEPAQPERLTREWVLMRSFRYGNTAGRVMVVLSTSFSNRLRNRLVALIQGGGRVLVGGMQWAFGKATGSLMHRARGQRKAYRGAGMAAGAVGFAFNEYGIRRAPHA
jgi:glycosyltransferase involved in cell wall biosynthesis